MLGRQFFAENPKAWYLAARRQQSDRRPMRGDGGGRRRLERAGVYNDDGVLLRSAIDKFFLWNRRKSLKSPDSDERIQGNPSIFDLVFLGFVWSGLVLFGLAWRNLAAPR
jgi:hypothetical protein